MSTQPTPRIVFESAMRHIGTSVCWVGLGCFKGWNSNLFLDNCNLRYPSIDSGAKAVYSWRWLLGQSLHSYSKVVVLSKYPSVFAKMGPAPSGPNRTRTCFDLARYHLNFYSKSSDWMNFVWVDFAWHYNCYFEPRIVCMDQSIYCIVLLSNRRAGTSLWAKICPHLFSFSDSSPRSLSPTITL